MVALAVKFSWLSTVPTLMREILLFFAINFESKKKAFIVKITKYFVFIVRVA